MSHSNLLRTLAGEPHRWAALAQRLGDCKPGDALTVRTLADDIGHPMESTLQLLNCWESLGWVRSHKGAFGFTHWVPTSMLPSVDRMDSASDHALASLLLSAVLTIQSRGGVAECG